jgi:hypothetical protein
MKKGLIILGSIIVLIVGYLFWYYTSSADDEIHLLPKDFTGIVIIRFNVVNGKEERYEDGILDTKFKINEGWSDLPKLYYLDGNKRIPIIKYKVYSQQIGGAISDITNKEVSYISYILSDEKHVDSLYTVLERMNVADAK